jgi:uncharacterized membrane protein YraQ (UPF0718 family)
MNATIEFIAHLFYSGLGNLAAYLAAHVLLCLLPAFYIAGAMTSLIPKEIITRYLGRNTPKLISYPAAAAAGFLLAVCSCTGMDLAIARLVLSLAFGIGVGIIMALIFRKEDEEHDKSTDALFAGQASMRKASVIFLLALVILLIVGTFQIDLLKTTYYQLDFQFQSVTRLQEYLFTLVPFDPAKGEEGVTAQGALLIGMLVLIGLTAWRGIEKIHDGFNLWTWISTGLVGLTLLIAALGVNPYPGGVALQFTGKFFGVLLTIILLGWMIPTQLTQNERRDFLWETWRFIKQIFPLLIVGVFAVGVIRELIKPEWIQAIAGENTLIGNFVGVVFGVFMYFPTLVEVPIAQMFLALGMHRGPLLAYLISDPELSLQSILITATIIGRTKAWVYVAWVSLFSTVAGLLYGAWVNGTSLGLVSIYLLLFLGLIAGLFWIIEKRNAQRVVVEH